MSKTHSGRFQLARLDTFPADIDTTWMTEDEASRLAVMHSAERRRSFIVGHRLARDLTAGWLDVDAARITLDRHRDGRPRLLLDGAPAPMHASLSHSGDWIVAAIATVPVGVDVEVPRRARDLERLARHTFSPDEVLRIQSLEDPQRLPAFLETWALKEARGKRTGEGFLPGRSRLVTSSRSDEDVAEARSWRLGDGAVALALEPGSALEIDDGGVLSERAFWRYLDLAEP